MTTTDDQTPKDTTEADSSAGVSCAAAYGSLAALLPCPFCGQPASVHEVSLYTSAPKSYYVAHDDSANCKAQVGQTYCNCPWDGCTADFDTKEEAIAAWNRRPENAPHEPRGANDQKP